MALVPNIEETHTLAREEVIQKLLSRGALARAGVLLNPEPPSLILADRKLEFGRKLLHQSLGSNNTPAPC